MKKNIEQQLSQIAKNNQRTIFLENLPRGEKESSLSNIKSEL